MEHTSEQIYEHIGKFSPIGKAYLIPEGQKITFFCNSGDIATTGFAENTTYDELGLNALIVESWILQSELDKLCSEKKDIKGNEEV